VKYLAYAIPLIALIGVATTYALTVLPTPSVPAAMDYSFRLLIQVSDKSSSQVRAIAPGHSIGEAGGDWATTKYNNNSIDASHYPVYMDTPGTACTPVCLIHVKSRIVHAYTLGDFFSVWGQPLGENNTIGIPRNGSFAWQLCLGLANNAISSNAWSGLVLQSDMAVTLFFYDAANGLGCAPS